MTVVDTSVWIDYFNGVSNLQSDVLDSLLGLEPLAIGDLILTEILQGVRTDAHFRIAKKLLLSLTIFDMLGMHRAIRSAEYYRTLRRKGVTIRKTSDVIIACFCIDEGHSLMSSDRDFLPFVEHFGLQLR